MAESLELVVITGMSGAGKTVAMRSFEDLGFYCIDNMPPSILPTFWELIKESDKINRVALVVDLRTREFFDDLERVLSNMIDTQHVTTRILFLDASDTTLVSRYKETRRKHPLAEDDRILVGIQRERALLETLKARAQIIIDTTGLKPKQLRAKINEHFDTLNQETFHIEVMSFGFKYGAPIDPDIIMDVRFLPNPYYIEELRPLTGEDSRVYDYVMQQPETEQFYKRFMELIRYCMPGYKKEGKAVVTIGIGCTGGKHRSVSLARRIAKDLANDDYRVNITHRDSQKK